MKSLKKGTEEENKQDLTLSQQHSQFLPLKIVVWKREFKWVLFETKTNAQFHLYRPSLFLFLKNKEHSIMIKFNDFKNRFLDMG